MSDRLEIFSKDALPADNKIRVGPATPQKLGGMMAPGLEKFMEDRPDTIRIIDCGGSYRTLLERLGVRKGKFNSFETSVATEKPEMPVVEPENEEERP